MLLDTTWSGTTANTHLVTCKPSRTKNNMSHLWTLLQLKLLYLACSQLKLHPLLLSRLLQSLLLIRSWHHLLPK